MVDTLARTDQLIDANIRRFSKRGRFWLLTVASVDVLPVHGANDHRDHACRPGRKAGRRFCGQRHDQRSGRRRRYRGRRVDRRRTLQQAPRTTTRRFPEQVRGAALDSLAHALADADQMGAQGARCRARRRRPFSTRWTCRSLYWQRADRRGRVRRSLGTGPRRSTATVRAPGWRVRQPGRTRRRGGQASRWWRGAAAR